MPPADPRRDVAAAPRRLLIVDDDTELCALVTKFLQREGFAVDAVHDGSAGLAAALGGGHDLIVLDIMLPDIDGFELLRKIREGATTPVLMLTARGDHVDRVVGLEMGADDYLTKPFEPRELAARIRAVLRRATAPRTAPRNDEERLVVGDVVVDFTVHEARRGERVLALTPVQFRLLVELMRSAGRMVSRDHLSRDVLGRPGAPDDRSIDTHVSNLRQKLGADGMSLLRTVRSAGFLFERPDPPDR